MEVFADLPTTDARPPGTCVCHGWPFAETAPKAAGNGLHRVTGPDSTFRTLQPFFERIGITRVADITGLDRLGIPVYSAFVPRSRDSISVYHGKGFTPVDAKTGAVMEATERYVASRERLPDAVASYREVSAKVPTLDPRSINQTLHAGFTDNTPVAWLNGIDLLSGDRILVPHCIACYCMLRYPWQPSHTVTTSNGLASGNTLEEAACHALAEVIERDAHSILEIFRLQLRVLANRTPALDESRLNRLREEHAALSPSIDLDSLSGKAAVLVDCFRRADIEPELVYAGSECGAATVLCFLRERGTKEFSRHEYGAGADPDVTVAVIRAMTEVAQGRAAYLEAVREDLKAITRTTAHPGKERAPNAATDCGDGDRPLLPPTPLPGIASQSTTDIVDDIRIMLAGLRRSGIERCVMVDLSTPDIPVSVVRIIVPGLESWIVDRGKIGPRAKARWREFAARVQ
jgi:ribosomal protein S12 methylthiotransferase accessory factor